MPTLRHAFDRRTALRLTASTLLAPVLPARALVRPADTIVLTVHGRVRIVNDAGAAQFDMAMLQQLPQASYDTRTPWFSQPRRFTGPLLRDVLSAAGAQGSTLRMVALNDYRVDMPWEDPQRHDVILARLLDGKPMAVRDKGPLLVMYPFDAHAELRNATHYSRAIWQLRAIEVL